MEYLQKPEVAALLNASFQYGNKEAHLALVLMYATGTRVSQALALKGIDIIPDPTTGGHRIRIGGAKNGRTRSFQLLASPNPALDMTPLVELAKVRGVNALFGALDRFYLHRLIKKFAGLAGLHIDMVSCHKIRHSCAMAIYTKTQRIGVVSGYLCHTDPATAFTYVAESDSQLGDAAMAEVFATT